jgi:hypothetical protein
MILKLILRYEEVDWTPLAEDRNQWQTSCEHINGHSDSIKVSELLDQLADSQLFRNDAVP